MDLFYLPLAKERWTITLLVVNPPFRDFQRFETQMTTDQREYAQQMLKLLYKTFPLYNQRFSLIKIIEFNTQLGSLKNQHALRKSLTADQKNIVGFAAKAVKIMGRFAPSTLMVGSECLFLDDQHYLPYFESNSFLHFRLGECILDLLINKPIALRKHLTKLLVPVLSSDMYSKIFWICFFN